MKCRECSCAKKGYFKSLPNAYVCTGVREPFIILNIDCECTEYPEKRYKIPTEDCLMIGFDNSPTDDTCMTILRVNKNGIKEVNTLWNEDALKAYRELIGID